MDKKVILITGISSGIGKELALLLDQSKYTIYGISRRENPELNMLGIKTYAVDITNSTALKNAVDNILKESKKIDILINNAGYGSYGAVEDVSIEEAKRQMNVNVFGLAEATKLVLPGMREQNYGKIVNVSSMAGKVWSPFGSWYHASKYAVEGFSNSLRLELEPFGIDVIVIEPGLIKTDWGIIAADNLEDKSKNGAYEKIAKGKAKDLREMYTNNDKLTKPIVIAEVIKKSIEVKRPKTRYLVGYSAKSAVLLQKYVSDRLFDKIIKKIF